LSGIYNNIGKNKEKLWAHLLGKHHWTRPNTDKRVTATVWSSGS